MYKVLIILGLSFMTAYPTSAQTSIDEMLQSYAQQAQMTLGYLLTGDDKLGPIEEEVRFFCYNRNTNEYRQVFVNDTDLSSKLDASKPLHMFVHGWISGLNQQYVQDIMEDLKTFLDVNACVLDWQRMANFFYTISATEYVPVVADYLAQFVTQANKFGISLDDVTIVGHSLGAHIAGQAGFKIQQLLGDKIGRIDGFDPAGPLFCLPADVGLSKRLDPTDAKFVQVIHTSDAVFGCAYIQGHQEFKPDGGIIPQNGCILPIFGQTTSVDPPSCSHGIAALYYRYSLNPANRFTGRKCENPLDFFLGSCNAKTSPITNDFGPYTNTELRGTFYLRTSPFAPFTSLPETGNAIIDDVTPVILLLTGLLEFLQGILENIFESLLKLSPLTP